ncbi:MAG TPA: YicC/YloC family endoribonuclease [Terriglobia bacterium]|nr:YicC/YloC family endoribonuclease [Terriglobia bacterium]
MIRSMTGYSNMRTEEAGFSLSVSVKSTNHRNLDLQLRIPAVLESIEVLLRRQVKEHVARGHVELTVSLERAGVTGMQVDRKLVDAYLTAFRELRREFGGASEPDLLALLRVPGVVMSGNGELAPAEFDQIQKTLEKLIAEVLRRLNEMRAREGGALERDLRARLKRLKELAQGIEKLSNGISRLYYRRLENRMRDLLGEGPLNIGVDGARLAQEVAFLASRADIEEELTRFRSHLDQTTHLLDHGAEVGKKLDFLLQEMNREANTLLSKTTDVPEVGLEIGRQAIELKTEIEKMREQAQNIE